MFMGPAAAGLFCFYRHFAQHALCFQMSLSSGISPTNNLSGDTRGRSKLRIDVKITSMVVNVKVMVKELLNRGKPLEAPVCL